MDPTRWVPLVRAPLSSDFSGSSGSELDPLSTSDEDDGDLNGSEPEFVRPVARLTNDDDDVEEEEDDEVIDDVDDGDGFGVVARVPSLLDRNPEEFERVEIDGKLVALDGHYEKGGVFEGLEVEAENADGVLGGNPDSGENFDERLELDDGDGTVDEAVESELEVVQLDSSVDVERDEEVEVNSEGVEVVIFGDFEAREVGDGDSKQDHCDVLKGDADAAKCLTIKSDGKYGNEGTENPNKTVFHSGDSKINKSFADNLYALNGIMVVSGSTSTSELLEPDLLVNELASECSDSIVIKVSFPGGLHGDSKTMGIEGLVEGIVVQNGSHFKEDEFVKSNLCSTGKENTDRDYNNGRISGSEPMELVKSNSMDLEKDEIEEVSIYEEVESASEVEEVGNATQDFDEKYELDDSGSKYKKVEYGAIEAKGAGNVADDSNHNYGLVGKGDSDVVDVLPDKLDSNDASNATETLNEASLCTDDLKKTEFFYDNLDAVSETMVVSGSTHSTQLSYVLGNELTAESSDSVIIEEEKSPVDLLEGSKIMASNVVHNDSESVVDELAILEISEGAERMIEVLEGSLSTSRLDTDKKGKKEMVETTTKVPAGLGSSALPHRPTRPLLTRQKIVTSPNLEVASKPEKPMTEEELDNKKGKKEMAETTTKVPAGLGTSALPLRPTRPLLARQKIVTSPDLEVASNPEKSMTEEELDNKLDNDKKGKKEMVETTTKVPAGLDTSALPLRPTRPLPTREQIVTSPNLAVASKPEKPMTEEEKRLHEKVESIRVMFLRLVYRLGYSYEDFLPVLILSQLAHIQDIKDWHSGAMHAIKKALDLERGEEDKLDFACTILVIGKSGVGKSATINSIFDEEKTDTNPFKRETTSVRKFEGIVDGVKIQILDTPGLCPLLDQASNIKILRSIKKYMKKCQPDIVVYIDRLDARSRAYTDLPVIRLITSVLGSSIWSNALIAFTHASQDPPEGPSGLPLPYEAYVNQRYHVVQQCIRQAIGDMKLMNPLVLVENRSYSTRNKESKVVLPNRSIWISELLLFCYSSKIIAEATSLYKVRGSFLKKLFGFRSCSPPVNFPVNVFLPSLFVSKDHPNIYSDIDKTNEDTYEQVPPFYPLTECEIAKLTHERKRAYFVELQYRMELLGKIRRKEELRELREINRLGKDYVEKDPTIGFPTCLELPLSFDCDDPVYRYRSLKQRSKFLIRPDFDRHGWDHDCDSDSVSLKNTLAFSVEIPAAISVKLKKDKKDFNIEMESSISANHGKIGSTIASFDIQTIGNQQAYFLRGETKLKNLKRNEPTLGILVTCLGDTIATGLKLEDRLSFGDRANIIVKTGAVQTEGNISHGSIFEATVSPFRHALASLRLSLDNNHRHLDCREMLQSEVRIGRNSQAVVCVGMNNKNDRVLQVKVTSSDPLHTVLMGLIPIIVTIFRRMCGFLHD